MKQKIFNLLIIISFVILFFEVLFHRELVFSTILDSLNIWVNNLIPSMFPLFVISDILISYRLSNYIPKFIKKTFSKIFNASDHAIGVFFLSFFSGFPSNARITRALYDEGFITCEDASQILTFTHFANPLFVLSSVSHTFLNNEIYGYLILISHYLGNIIIGIVGGKFYTSSNINYTKTIDKSQNFSVTLINSIKKSIDTLLLVLGSLTCFLITSSIIIYNLNLNEYTSSIIKGILEMTMGLKSISLLNINDIYKVVISTMFISFGGFAVHMQVLSQLVDTDISYHKFFISRIFHALISGFICYLLYILLY